MAGEPVFYVLNFINFHYSVQPERVSFRAYLTVIYNEPKMKIYIQVSINLQLINNKSYGRY